MFLFIGNITPGFKALNVLQTEAILYLTTKWKEWRDLEQDRVYDWPPRGAAQAEGDIFFGRADVIKSEPPEAQMDPDNHSTCNFIVESQNIQTRP